MRTRSLLTTLVVLTSIQFSAAQFILTLNFENMDPYIAMQSVVRVTDMATGKEVGRRIYPAVTGADYSTDLYVLRQGRSYNVDIWIDVNDNGEYNMPPMDHAWRRTVLNATMHTTIDFSPDDMYTDIVLDDFFPYSRYDATWGGHWRNLTFGSTDSIRASLKVSCDSIFAEFMTAGVFGNPAPVMFDFSDELPGDFDPATDTISFSPPSPWTGEVYVINGQVHGDITLTGISLQFTGTVGETQILCLYTVLQAGNPFANGYFIVRELSIESSAPEIELNGDITHVTCGGASDGSIDLSVSGGTPGYIYHWSNGTTTEDITALIGGIYSPTVTDSEGCTAVASFTVNEPPVLQSAILAFSPVCHGGCDGYAQVNVLGGTPGYTYLWSDGVTVNQRDDLCVGPVTVTVTDVNGCSDSALAVVSQPDTILIDTTFVVHETGGQSNGQLGVAVSGGVPPYLYSLVGSVFQSSPLFTNLPAGEYCVYVMDANGCEVKSTVYEILDITSVQTLTSHFELYPNPAREWIQIKADVPLTVEVCTVLGHVILIHTPATTHMLNIEHLSSGTYIVRISDGVGVALRKLVVQK